jgi:hypothetical protein
MNPPPPVRAAAFFGRTIEVDADPTDLTPTRQAPHALGYQAPRSGKSVRIAGCANVGEAELICGELGAAGVPAVTVNQYTANLGPYAGGSQVEVHVAVEDAEHAAEVLARLPGPKDLEPLPEPPDGSADFATDDGITVPLAVVAELMTAQEMMDASATLGSARVRTYLPALAPRRKGAEGPPPVFRVRVAEEDLSRARAVLAEVEDVEEPRCPRCAAWRVQRQGTWLSWLLDFFRPEGVAQGVQAFVCLRCGERFTWGSPRGAFEVVAPSNDSPPTGQRRQQ